MMTYPIAARLATLYDQERQAQAAQTHSIRHALAAAADRHELAGAARRLPAPAASRAVQTVLLSVLRGAWWARPSLG